MPTSEALGGEKCGISTKQYPCALLFISKGLDEERKVPIGSQLRTYGEICLGEYICRNTKHYSTPNDLKRIFEDEW